MSFSLKCLVWSTSPFFYPLYRHSALSLTPLPPPPYFVQCNHHIHAPSKSQTLIPPIPLSVAVETLQHFFFIWCLSSFHSVNKYILSLHVIPVWSHVWLSPSPPLSLHVFMCVEGCTCSGIPLPHVVRLYLGRGVPPLWRVHRCT